MSRRVANPNNRIAETIEQGIVELTVEQPAIPGWPASWPRRASGSRPPACGVCGAAMISPPWRKGGRRWRPRGRKDALIPSESPRAALEKADKEADGAFVRWPRLSAALRVPRPASARGQAAPRQHRRLRGQPGRLRPWPRPRQPAPGRGGRRAGMGRGRAPASRFKDFRDRTRNRWSRRRRVVGKAEHLAKGPEPTGSW